MCFLVNTLACAASFDCGKAEAKVEKMICNDAELSRLDDELDSVYKSALKDKRHVAVLKESQRQWMKERDNFVDSEYFKKIVYKTNFLA